MAAEQQLMLLRAISSDLNGIGIELHKSSGGGGDGDRFALELYQDAFATLIAAMPQQQQETGEAAVQACSGSAEQFEDDRTGSTHLRRPLRRVGSEEEAIRRGAERIALGRERLAAMSGGYRPTSTMTSSVEMSVGDNEKEGDEHMPRTRLLSQPLHTEPYPLACRDARYSDSYVGDRHNLSAIVYNMGLVYYKREAYHTAEQLFEMALETVPEQCNDRPVDALVVHSSLNNLGHIRYCLGKHEEATKHFSEALRLVQKAYDQVGTEELDQEEEEVFDEEKKNQDYPACATMMSLNKTRQQVLHGHLITVMTNHALTLFAIGEACEQRGMLDEAMLVYVRIVKTRRTRPCKVPDPTASLVYSMVLFRMGNIHYCRGDKDKTVQAFTFALMLRREALGNDHADVAALVHDLGVVQLEADRVGEAMTSFLECLRIRRALLGSDHREVAEVLYRIGRIHQDSGNHKLALDAYNEALRVEQIALGADHPDVAITLTNIGQVHYLNADYGRALEAYREVLRMVGKSMGADHPSIAEIQTTIGTIHLNCGNDREAVDAFTEARRIERSAAAAGLIPPSSGGGSVPCMDVEAMDLVGGSQDLPNSPGAAAA